MWHQAPVEGDREEVAPGKLDPETGATRSTTAIVVLGSQALKGSDPISSLGGAGRPEDHKTAFFQVDGERATALTRWQVDYALADNAIGKLFGVGAELRSQVRYDRTDAVRKKDLLSHFVVVVRSFTVEDLQMLRLSVQYVQIVHKECFLPSTVGV